MRDLSPLEKIHNDRLEHLGIASLDPVRQHYEPPNISGLFNFFINVKITLKLLKVHILAEVVDKIA